MGALNHHDDELGMFIHDHSMQELTFTMQLASLFSDHMVIQRDRPIIVWGCAEPDDTITVALAGYSARVQAGGDGQWTVHLDALPAGGPHTLQAGNGKRTRIVHDVMIGEVWLCSGQSNMEWPLEMSQDSDLAIASASLPHLRLFTVPRKGDIRPLRNVEAGWSVSSPETATRFSAVAHHFGRKILENLDVPVGLIVAAWGGTPAQAWTSATGLESSPLLADHVQELQEILSKDTAEQKAAFQSLRQQFLARLPQDAGNRGLGEGWAEPGFDDARWQSMRLPQYWNKKHPTNGVFWFRKVIDLPDDWTGKTLELSLGAADKSDDTYFNGRRVGGLSWSDDRNSWNTIRRYRIPAGLAKAGANLIAVRVLSNYTGGGLVGPDSAMSLHRPAEDPTLPISLTGEWHYQIEQDFGKVTGHAEPVPVKSERFPTMLFNGMIAPLIPFPIRGVIWYQGESNADDAERYRTLFPALIRDWRSLWGQGDFPFLFVQLANFQKQPSDRESDNSRWAELREAQAMARILPATGMAVTIDIGDANDIHPRNKADVGLRQALVAMAQVYRQDVPCRGPAFHSLEIVGSALHITFDHAVGLSSRGNPVRGFAIAGADRRFHAADGAIAGQSVVVTSPHVPHPVAVRYGWADCPTCTLWNAAGLPAEPFRSDSWPVGPEPVTVAKDRTVAAASP